MKESRINGMAKAIAERLMSWPALEGVGVVVDRQSDIRALVLKATGDANGICLTVMFDGLQDENPGSSIPRYDVNYTVRAFGRAILQEAAFPDGSGIPADYAIEQALLALRHWRPPPEVQSLGELQVSGGDLVPNASALVYELTATAPMILGDPEPAYTPPAQAVPPPSGILSV